MSSGNTNLSANLNVMIDAVRRASRGLIRDFGEVENLLSSARGPEDFAAKAAPQAEEFIRDALSKARPAYGWLSEVGGAVKGPDPTRRWIVSPLQGAVNFQHGVPHWAISIALEHKSDIVAGVTFDPIKNELFFAEKGGGAYMNTRRLRVSQRLGLSHMVFGSSLPAGGRSGLPRRVRELVAALPQSAAMMQTGSAALDLGWVAAGRLDAWWDAGLQPWDVAAGVVLAREAGGMVASLDPDLPPQEGALITGAEGVYTKLKTMVEEAR